ncbi:hypothetical protein ABZ951_15605 [Streptomyces sp. NPDC046215]
MTVFADLPYAAGRTPDTDLAARLVAACRAGCEPCQTSMARKVSADRPTLAVLAGAVYGLPLNRGAARSPLASSATRLWAPLALAAAESGDGTAAFAALEQLSDAAAAELLEDALDHWAAGAAPLTPRALDADSQGSATVSDDGAPESPFKVVRLLLDDPDGVPRYRVILTRAFAPDGQPLPMLTLECETAGAGIEDLRRRTEWKPWDRRRMPELDVTWRLRADIDSRSLLCLTHVTDDGYDELPHLWDAAETVPLPEHWWNLLDRTEHVLVAGPVKDAADGTALDRAADAGELLAVVACVRFA